MSKPLLLVLIGATVWLAMTNRISLGALDPRSVGTEIDGRTVLRTANQIEGRFTRLGVVEETYMLFGGDGQQRRNQLTHATLAGLPIRHARAIAQQYPDFHRCKSPGAPQAQRLTESMNLVAANRSTRGTLIEALDLFEERLQSGGDRTCLRVRGSELVLDSVRIPEEDRDISSDVVPALSRSRFLLAEDARIEDCLPLLR
ncbi:MAG: hypothetical protein CL908_08585 [Deltaproteobacteria bacterium]|jgi:hypothetical protein|nr:hypothetical protein [Deltaproteobacteria bacterium]